jgi:hypothetical protein
LTATKKGSIEKRQAIEGSTDAMTKTILAFSAQKVNQMRLNRSDYRLVRFVIKILFFLQRECSSFYPGKSTATYN